MYDAIIIICLFICFICSTAINMKGNEKIRGLRLEGLALENQVKRLERRLSLSERSLEHAGYEYNEAIEEKNAMEQRLSKAASHFEKLYLQKREENKELSIKIGRINRIRSLETDRASKKAEKIKRLNSELSIANKSIRNLSGENKNLKAKLNTSISVSKINVRQVRALQEYAADNAKAMAKLKRSNDTLHKVVENMRDKFSEKVGEVESLKVEMSDDKNLIQALKCELSTIKNMSKDEKGAK